MNDLLPPDRTADIARSVMRERAAALPPPVVNVDSIAQLGRRARLRRATTASIAAAAVALGVGVASTQLIRGHGSETTRVGHPDAAPTTAPSLLPASSGRSTGPFPTTPTAAATYLPPPVGWEDNPYVQRAERTLRYVGATDVGAPEDPGPFSAEVTGTWRTGWVFLDVLRADRAASAEATAVSTMHVGGVPVTLTTSPAWGHMASYTCSGLRYLVAASLTGNLLGTPRVKGTVPALRQLLPALMRGSGCG